MQHDVHHQVRVAIMQGHEPVMLAHVCLVWKEVRPTLFLVYHHHYENEAQLNAYLNAFSLVLY